MAPTPEKKKKGGLFSRNKKETRARESSIPSFACLCGRHAYSTKLCTLVVLHKHRLKKWPSPEADFRLAAFPLLRLDPAVRFLLDPSGPPRQLSTSTRHLSSPSPSPRPPSSHKRIRPLTHPSPLLPPLPLSLPLASPPGRPLPKLPLPPTLRATSPPSTEPTHPSLKSLGTTSPLAFRPAKSIEGPLPHPARAPPSTPITRASPPSTLSRRA
jgi:hypothetical protein